MTGATPDYAELAQRLLTHDSALFSTAAECAAAVSNVNQRLHHRLAPLVGVTGMRALFARSVKLTCVQHPALSALRSPEFGDNAGIAEPLVELLSKLEYGVARAAATALYTNFLGLTSTLIGERLVLLVLQRAFPKLDVTAKQESES
ncbi:MAG TPA: hypothetical protein VIK01_28845 [Polyangiaceae bacterium]